MLTVGRTIGAIVIATGATPSVDAQQTARVTDEQLAAEITKADADPKNAELQYRVAVSYWFMACVPRNPICEDSARRAEMQAKYVELGLSAVDRALNIRPDFIDAVAYKNLLLRSKAALEPERRDELLRAADQVLEQFLELTRNPKVTR